MGLIVSYEKRSDGYYTYKYETEIKPRLRKAFRIKSRHTIPLEAIYNPNYTIEEYEKMGSLLEYNPNLPSYSFLEFDEKDEECLNSLKKLIYYYDKDERPLSLPSDEDLIEPPIDWVPDIDPIPKCEKSDTNELNNKYIYGSIIAVIIASSIYIYQYNYNKIFE